MDPPAMASQTQESTVTVIPESPTNRLVVVACGSPTVPLDGSPTADNTAIAEMTSGRTNDDKQNDYVRAGKHTRMVLFNDKNGKHKTIKLTATSAFTFLHHGFVKALSDDLLAARRTASSSAASVRKAQSFFDIGPSIWLHNQRDYIFICRYMLEAETIALTG
jgi:hypothetical protein